MSRKKQDVMNFKPSKGLICRGERLTLPNAGLTLREIMTKYRASGGISVSAKVHETMDGEFPDHMDPDEGYDLEKLGNAEHYERRQAFEKSVREANELRKKQAADEAASKERKRLKNKETLDQQIKDSLDAQSKKPKDPTDPKPAL